MSTGPAEEFPDESPAEAAEHELDMIPVFSETGATAEIEWLAVQGVLEANAIPFAVSGTPTLPAVEFVVSVPRARFEEARRVLAEAEASGPAAAEEAERESEARGERPE